MFSYLLSNVYELVARATLLALAVFPASGIYSDIIKSGGEAVEFSDFITRGILVIAGFLTNKQLAQFSGVVAAGGFAYLFSDEAVKLATELYNAAALLIA